MENESKLIIVDLETSEISDQNYQTDSMKIDDFGFVFIDKEDFSINSFSFSKYLQ